MANCETQQNRTSILVAAGFSADAATAWNNAAPEETTTFSSDRFAYSDFWLKSARLIAQLPAAAHRNEPERAAAVNEYTDSIRRMQSALSLMTEPATDTHRATAE